LYLCNRNQNKTISKLKQSRIKTELKNIVSHKAFSVFALVWKNGYNMKTNNVSVREVQVTNRNAKAQVSSVSHNILFYVRALNKLAVKNEYCENKDVLSVAKNVRSLLAANVVEHMSNKEYFHASAFMRDYQGRVCSVCDYKGSATVTDVITNDVITEDGKQLIMSKDGQNVCILRPVTLSLTGVFNAFCAFVLRDAKAAAAAEKAAEKAANKRAKEFARLSKQFANGEISGATFRAEIARIESEIAA